MQIAFHALKFGEKFTVPGYPRLFQKELGKFAVNAFGPAIRGTVDPITLCNVLPPSSVDEYAQILRGVRRGAK